MSLPSYDSLIVTRLRAAGCVFAEDEARLLIRTAQNPGDLATMVERRIAGYPLEHVLGWAEFAGLRIAVEAGVFVPRRRTEFLIEQAAVLVREAVGSAEQATALARLTTGTTITRPTAVVVDLCCGTGAMGAALVATLDRFELHAVDIEPAAVRCARRNLTPIGGHVYEGDLYAPLPDSLRGHVDVLVASPPYVPTDAIRLLPPEARDHEPLVTLDGGADGLQTVRRLIAEAPRWLAPGGYLLVETSERQAGPTMAAVSAAGLIPQLATDEELDATVVIGSRSARHN